MHSHCSRNFSATLPARIPTRSCKLRMTAVCSIFIFKVGNGWICFLRMHDVCLDENQDMAGIFVVEVIGRKKDVSRLLTLVMGEGGVTRDLSVSHSLAVQNNA